jgi:hypothetical protein
MWKKSSEDVSSVCPVSCCGSYCARNSSQQHCHCHFYKRKDSRKKLQDLCVIIFLSKIHFTTNQIRLKWNIDYFHFCCQESYVTQFTHFT